MYSIFTSNLRVSLELLEEYALLVLTVEVGHEQNNHIHIVITVYHV